MIIVSRKNGMQMTPEQSMQSHMDSLEREIHHSTARIQAESHMDSIHSPQRTRKTIMNEWRKSEKFQRGTSSGKYFSL